MTPQRRMAPADIRARGYLSLVFASSAAIVTVEALLVVPGHLLAAQIANAVLVFVLVNAGPRRERDPAPEPVAAGVAALRALALVPLIRVVALGLPMRDWTEPVAVLAVALPVGLVALRLAPVIGLRLRRLFSPKLGLADLYAASAGAVLGLLAYLAGAPALWPEGAGGHRIVLAVAAAVVAACVEELVFRGLLQGALQRLAGRLGMLVAIALFTATYLAAGPLTLVLAVALASVVFGHSVAVSGALGGVIVGHVLFVVGAGAVWPVLLDERGLPRLNDPGTSIALSVAIAVAIAVACRQPIAARSTTTRT